MNDFELSDLQKFIIKAKSVTYVGGGKKLLPYRLGSHDLQYFENDWAYHDSYLGESDFTGQEAVYYKGIAVWAMNYFGRILRPERITSAEAGDIIQESLTLMYQEGRFLGGFTHPVQEFVYHDTSSGELTFFTGREWIEKDGILVYELVYHGGLIHQLD